MSTLYELNLLFLERERIRKIIIYSMTIISIILENNEYYCITC